MRAAAKRTGTGIEPWNQEALKDARDWSIPQYWVLITPLECHALLDGIVSTRLKNACADLKAEVLVDYPEEPAT